MVCLVIRAFVSDFKEKGKGLYRCKMRAENSQPIIMGEGQPFQGGAPTHGKFALCGAK
jgi:hypothetical protein